jgi:hypothetical protein
MIPKEHDDYVEMKYSDEIYVHVWSHDNGEGSFELEAIIPHAAVGDSVDVRSESTLPPNLPNYEKFYDDITQYLGDVTGDDWGEVVFYLSEVVDDGSWENHASAYYTHELEAELK